METKYVVIHYPNKGEAIFIFPEIIVHKEFAQCNAGMGCKIVSAGFVTEMNDGLFCYGRSESLDINSRPNEDSILANRLFKGEL